MTGRNRSRPFGVPGAMLDAASGTHQDRTMTDTRRDDILRAAAAELNQNGVTSATRANIAERTGLSRSAIYDRFGDNAALLLAAYRETCAFLAARFEDAAAEGGAAAGVLGAFVAGVHRDSAREYAFIGEGAHLDAAQREAVTEEHDALCVRIAEVLSRGIASGEVRALDPVVVAQAIVGMATWPWLVRRWLPDLSPAVLEHLPDVLADLVRGGNAAAPADRPFAWRPLVPSSMLSTAIFDPEQVAAAKREALLAGGSWLFNRQGVHALGLEAVAERYGVSKTVIYHNLGRKDAFVAACYERAYDMFERVADDLEGEADDPCGALANAVYRIAHAYRTPPLSPLAPSVGMGSLAAGVQERVARTSARMGELYERSMRTGVARGEIRPGRVFLRVVLVPGYFEWIPRWSGPEDEADTDHVAEEVARFWAFGLSVTGER